MSIIKVNKLQSVTGKRVELGAVGDVIAIGKGAITEGFGDGGSNVGSINDLSDVNTETNTPNPGDALGWDGGKWVPFSGAAGEGSPGKDGDDGAQGPPGPVGPVGPPGTGIHVQGSVDDSSQLPGLDGTYGGQEGDAYITLDTGHLWVWGANGAWDDLGEVQGPSGNDGVDGVDGADGADGKDGLPGLQGIPGQTGTPGTDGVDGSDGVNGIDGEPGTDGVDGVDGLGADTKIDELIDVDTTSVPPTIGDHLEWNGTNWIPVAPKASGDEFDALVDLVALMGERIDVLEQGLEDESVMPKHLWIPESD